MAGIRPTTMLLLSLAALSVVAAATEARTVHGGSIVAGKGAAGVKLDMTRDQVLERLGKPSEQNPRFMGYSRHRLDQMFDVYLDEQSPRRVRMIGIYGKRFRLDGIHIFKKGGLRKLMRRFGSRLEPLTIETGDPVYRITGSYHGREVWTEFSVLRHSPSSPILDLFILFPNPLV